jgi:hypothetical protein
MTQMKQINADRKGEDAKGRKATSISLFLVPCSLYLVPFAFCHLYRICLYRLWQKKETVYVKFFWKINNYGGSILVNINSSALRIAESNCFYARFVGILRTELELKDSCLTLRDKEFYLFCSCHIIYWDIKYDILNIFVCRACSITMWYRRL